MRVLLICLLFLALVWSCGRKETQVVDLNDLMRIQLGEIVHLSELLKQPAEMVCVLPPYTDKVDAEQPHSEQINAYLKSVNYMATEGWAMLFVNGDTVMLQTFGAQPITATRWHEGRPKGFKPVQCASVARAIVIKVDSFAPSLMLGEER
jgi:hypothetical protein